MSPRQRRFDRLVGMLALAGLAVGILWVLRPFVSAVVWAIVLTYSTWPVFEFVRRSMHCKSTLAASVMTALLTLVILLPVTVLVLSLGDSVARVAEAIRSGWEHGLPDPPQWVGELPLIGSSLQKYWADLAHDSVKLGSEIRRLLEPLRSWLLSGGLQLGVGLVYLVLSVVLAFFFYRDGDAAALAAQRVLHRIAGSRAARLTAVAGGTIRSVVYGILGTAFAQAILAAIGMWIAGVPGALLWAMLTFFLSVVPVGPPLVWGGAVIWLFYQDSVGWAVFMALWGFFGISGIDNIVKPYLISRGSHLPFILTLLGVLGGALAFGFIGVFLGPLLLALGYRLLQEWVSTEPEPSLGQAPSEDRSHLPWRTATRESVADRELRE